jgi:hypothetical protein
MALAVFHRGHMQAKVFERNGRAGDHVALLQGSLMLLKVADVASSSVRNYLTFDGEKWREVANLVDVVAAAVGGFKSGRWTRR